MMATSPMMNSVPTWHSAMIVSYSMIWLRVSCGISSGRATNALRHLSQGRLEANPFTSFSGSLARGAAAYTRALGSLYDQVGGATVPRLLVADDKEIDPYDPVINP